MSVIVETEQKLVAVKVLVCDGPSHTGDRRMDFDTITLSHGYGSPRDGDLLHFCCDGCLRDWLEAQLPPVDQD